jgi:hypothetical protein
MKQPKHPVKIRWVFETKDIKYIDVFDYKYLTFGFDQSSVNLLIGDVQVTERLRVKIDKIIKH